MATHSSFSITYICTPEMPFRSTAFYQATHKALQNAEYGASVSVTVRHEGKPGEACRNCGETVKPQSSSQTL